MSLPRLAVLCDFPEEGWPSMDLAAEMLLRQLQGDFADRCTAVRVCPPFRRRFSRLPVLGRRRAAFNADRLLNRFLYYPASLRRVRRAFDLFHVVDHTYAQLVHALPAERTGVFCFDLDAFRSLLEPDRDRRPAWFRALARCQLRGLQSAARVFYATSAVRREIEKFGLVDPGKLEWIPLGVAPEFRADGVGDVPPPGLPDDAPFLLHVGSTIPRKRIDVLLDVFAEVRAARPGVRLVKVGGPWTAAQQEQMRRLGVGDAVVSYTNLDREAIAALYRRAAVVQLPSEAEGFGLPVIEALACGSVVLASDLPVLREVGGAAALYRPVGDVEAWASATLQLLDDPGGVAPSRLERLAWARRFTWAEHAAALLAAYRRLL